MKIVLLTIETSKEEWLQVATQLYQEKIGRFQPFEVVRLKSRSSARDAQDRKIKEEAELLLSKIEISDFVIVCDEKGKSLDSKTFSKKMISALESGKKKLVFIIGGAFGLDDSVRFRAQWVWSFSPMTMNHFVAQTVAMEQIYRALTIWKGVPYHNE